MNDRNAPLAKAKALFVSEGLPFPPVTVDTGSTWYESSSNFSFATRKLDVPLYQLGYYFDEARQARAQEYAAVGFDGHGINSWAMHFYLVKGPAAIFLQCRWGNALDDIARARERIEGVTELTSQLIDALIAAQGEGRLPSGQSLLLRFSDFAGSGWGWIGQADSWRAEEDFTLIDAIGAVEALP